MVHSRSMFAAILATSFECIFAAPIDTAFSAGGVQRNVFVAFPQISGSSANSADPHIVSGPPYAALVSSPAEVDAKFPRDISVTVHKSQDAVVNCYLDKGRRSREDSNYSGFCLEPHDLHCGVMLPCRLGPSDVLNGPVRRAEDGPPKKNKKKVHFPEEVVAGTSQTPPPIDIEETQEQITLRKQQEESHAFNEELRKLYANTSPPRGRPPGLLLRPAKVTKPRPKSPSSKSLTRPPGKSDEKRIP
ncbi:hypothetical protein F5050DRAFT_551435 [Lentinula boryana]|uniref:Uncharacterized protein n=1 Tax=Lentinula boryana TaxID=40481 RepID=A0ABQ8Q6T6_9AGAR|nr:hypothetical protein F5050DRAFT_551435 [Lentinula boryana]